jgi:hypothetical protein
MSSLFTLHSLSSPKIVFQNFQKVQKISSVFAKSKVFPTFYENFSKSEKFSLNSPSPLHGKICKPFTSLFRPLLHCFSHRPVRKIIISKLSKFFCLCITSTAQAAPKCFSLSSSKTLRLTLHSGDLAAATIID